MSKSVKSAIVVTVDSLPLFPLEPTEDPVWLSKTCRCRRYTITGIPGRLVDVIVDDRITTSGEAPEGMELVCSVVRKAGHFDGAERDRIAFRAMDPRDARYLAHGQITVGETSSAVAVAITRPGMRGWAATYPRLRSDLDDYCLPRIVMWHWRRYYAMLPAEDVTVLANSMTWFPDGTVTLAEANRAASRALYRLARDLGWRKLTLRERRILGLDSMWVSEETYSAAHDRLGHPTGCGEATLAAARDSEHYERVAELWRD